MKKGARDVISYEIEISGNWFIVKRTKDGVSSNVFMTNRKETAESQIELLRTIDAEEENQTSPV